MSFTEFNKYINSPEFKAVLKQYENALESGELVFFDSDDLVDVAEYYHISGDLEKAEAAADYCLRLHPKESSALLFKARMALVDYGDLDHAKEYLSKVEEEAECLETVYVTAEVMIVESKLKEADDYLQEKYALYMKRREGGQTSDEIEEDSDDPDFALDVAMMYCDHGFMDYAEAWMKKTSIPDGESGLEYYDTWAKIYIADEKWTEAECVLNKEIDIDAYNVLAWLMLSDVQFHQARYQDALQSSEYAIAIAPNDPEPYISKGNSLYALNHLEDACKCFEHFLELIPGDPVGELLLMSTFFCQSKIKEAYELAKTLLKHIDDLPDIQMEDALRTCAIVAAKYGDQSLAMECCDRMETFGLPEEDVDIARGSVCLESMEIKKAMAYFSKAVEATDYDLSMVARVGMLCYEGGLLFVAYQMLKEAIGPYEESEFCDCPPRILAFLTGACFHLKKREEYLYYLKYAVEIAPLETAAVIGENFPSGTEPRCYYEIEKNKKE